MKIGDKITDGTVTFLVRSTGGVQSVNNVRPDDTGNINITNVDNANHANTATTADAAKVADSAKICTGNSASASSVPWNGVTGKPGGIVKVTGWNGSTLNLTTAT